jgi:nucleoside-diphosphate-sugar epimerase
LQLSEVILVTGGAGYIGAALCRELISSGRRVRAFDVLLHDQREVADDLEREGAEVLRADLLDGEARRRALEGVAAVVHLAAIVGDPACAQDPERAQAVNVDAARALVEDAAAAGVERFVMASTCSNYGKMADSSVPVDESGELAPVSLYARQKVEVEQWLLSRSNGTLAPICLRFATVYGVAPRMRFDLTVNEFTRDMWAGRVLQVFGERFWRPYIHVRDAGRAVRVVLDSPLDRVQGEVFNAGRTDQNFRKLDLVEIVGTRYPEAEVEFVEQADDPRDYKVNFEKIKQTLGFDLTMTVPEGIGEVADELERGSFPDPFERRYRNIP